MCADLDLPLSAPENWWKYHVIKIHIFPIWKTKNYFFLFWQSLDSFDIEEGIPTLAEGPHLEALAYAFSEMSSLLRWKVFYNSFLTDCLKKYCTTCFFKSYWQLF